MNKHIEGKSMKKCVCGEEMTPAEWKNQWVCHRCGRTKPMRTTVTNADRIRAMSDEELAVFLEGIQSCSRCMRRGNNCFPHWDALSWLQKPAEEERA